MKKLSLATLIVVALGTGIAGYAAPASATIVYITVTGTVASGTDGSGLFGTAGADLFGDAYTAQYEIDTSLGSTDCSATTCEAYGGTGFTNGASNTSPSLGASLTINGQSVLIAGTYNSEIIGANATYYSESYSAAADSAGVQLFNEIFGNPGDRPTSITTAFSVTANDNKIQGGAFSDEATSLFLNSAVYTESLSAPVVPSAVPEPASMALLGVGMLGTGVMARRRRQFGATPTAC